jgi:hypothetical protein
MIAGFFIASLAQIPDKVLDSPILAGRAVIRERPHRGVFKWTNAGVIFPAGVFNAYPMSMTLRNGLVENLYLSLLFREDIFENTVITSLAAANQIFF